MNPRSDPDLYRASSLDNALGNLEGPLQEGAASTPLEIGADGRLDVAWETRRPVVLAVLATALGTESLVVRASLEGSDAPLSPVRFAPYTEAGATLALYCPDASGGKDSLLPFALSIGAALVTEEGESLELPESELASRVGFRLLEGNAGKLLHVLLHEKARMRRQAREIVAMRLLDGARRDALDRIGAGLGVARCQDDIVYDAEKGEILTVALTDAAGSPILESDTDYARRLSIYHPFLLGSPERFAEVLNGEGDASDPNAGPLAGLGLTARLVLGERDNPFALAFRIVGVGSDAPRINFLNYLRNDVLVWISNSAAANAAHAARYVPQTKRDETDALRARLRSGFSYPADAAVAPALANALDRLGRVLDALGAAGKLKILRAQDPDAGSRYEMGLGVDLAAFTPEDLAGLQARMEDAARTPSADDLAESLIAVLRANLPGAEDGANGAWLFGACGFQTVHRLDVGALYLSHLPTLGLVVNGPTTVPGPTPGAGPPATGAYDAHFYPDDDPAIDAALLNGLQGGASDWATAGGEPWTQLAPADQVAAWSRVVAPTAAAMETFAAGGLPALAAPASALASLANVPPDLVATLTLPEPLASEVLAGSPGAGPALQSLIQALRGHSLASAVPFATSAAEVLLVVSVLGLPQIGVNLGERRTSGFRWYAVPLGGQGTVKPLGGTTSLQGAHPGAVALVCLGYARQGLSDPYEVRVDLPDGATLSLRQYEFLMNALERLCPLGVEVDTYSIRQSHVDLAGTGVATPLKPDVFRTYRRFQRDRLRGVYQEGV